MGTKTKANGKPKKQAGYVAKVNSLAATTPQKKGQAHGGR